MNILLDPFMFCLNVWARGRRIYLGNVERPGCWQMWTRQVRERMRRNTPRPLTRVGGRKG